LLGIIKKCRSEILTIADNSNKREELYNCMVYLDYISQSLKMMEVKK
jgi:hypothetical protein